MTKNRKESRPEQIANESIVVTVPVTFHSGKEQVSQWADFFVL